MKVPSILRSGELIPGTFSTLASALLVASSTAMIGCSGTPVSVSVAAAAQAIDAGETVGITATVPERTGVTWSVVGPGTLKIGGLSATYVAPAPNTSITSSQQATITARSTADPTKSASVQITVNPYPYIPNQTLVNGSVNTPYSQSIAFVGGTPPFQWSVYDGPIDSGLIGWRVGGAVPDGLTLEPSTGGISGTPISAGTWWFEAAVTDATGAVAANGFLSIQIDSSAQAANPVPFLNQALAPEAVAPGSASLTLNVIGAGFVQGSTVEFDGAALATTFVNADHLSATLPAADIATAKTASVTVVNPAPGGGQSGVVYFQVGTPEGTVNFANATNSPLRFAEPTGVVVGDFNGDGRPDLAITDFQNVHLMLGKGDGTFTEVQGSPFPMPSPPYDDGVSPVAGPGLAVGDFNHSGHLGLAVGLEQNDAVVTLFGNGDGTFTYADTLANTFGFPTNSLTAADFNRDGYLDLAVTSGTLGESPVVLLGDGRGVFNDWVPSYWVSAISSAAGDFNGDGKLDLALDGTNILLGNGDGTFMQGAMPDAKGSYVTVGDFNGDGKLDLAVCNLFENSVTIFLGNGDGTFSIAPGSPIFVGSEPWAIAEGDFNNDGKLDLAVANYGDNTVTLLLGNGDGTFTPAVGSPYAVGREPSAITAADFNGDGKLDLVVVNSLDATVSILLQQ